MKTIMIQGIGLLGTAAFLLSYQFKCNKKMFSVQLISYLLYTVHFVLLGAVTGGISYLINAYRSYCLSGNNKFLKSKYMCGIICLLQVVVMFVTWKNWLSLLPVVGNIASTIAGYSHNGKKIRLTGIIINSPVWLVYNIIFMSWAGILDEILSEVSMITSICRFGIKNLDNNNSN